VLGAGNTAVFLAGYAAADIGDDAMRGRAIGTVLFAAALGAVVSPNLLGPSGELARLLGLPPLTGLYVIAVLCFSVAALLLAAVSDSGAPYLRSRAALLGAHTSSRVSQEDIIHGLSASPTRAALAILAATNLVMVDGRGHGDSPVHLVAHGHDLGLIGMVVGIHVAGMLVPSPISGWMADRIGPTPVAGAGFLLIVASGVASFLTAGGALSMTVVLLMLEVGWNFGVVGEARCSPSPSQPSCTRT
jgi:hypothetical protein